jgi:prevent-host-death family protein
MLREIGAFEAKNKLGTLLDWVEQGEEVLITRRGKAVARLVPAEAGFDRERARRAAADIRARSVGVRLDGLRIKDLVDEGRP